MNDDLAPAVTPLSPVPAGPLVPDLSQVQVLPPSVPDLTSVRVSENAYAHVPEVSARAWTDRSVVSSIQADLGEAACWREALATRAEVGLQAPGGVHYPGPDFITAVTFDDGAMTIILTDVKTSTVGKFPSSEPPEPDTWRKWVDEAAQAVASMDLGDPVLEASIRQALDDGRVEFRQIEADYSPEGQGRTRGW